MNRPEAEQPPVCGTCGEHHYGECGCTEDGPCVHSNDKVCRYHG